MLAETQSRPRLGNWGIFAVAAGALLGLAVLILGNYKL
jgi:hypothetical protein